MKSAIHTYRTHRACAHSILASLRIAVRLHLKG